MSTTHTPGPWEIEHITKTPFFLINSVNGETVAKCNNDLLAEENRANAAHIVHCVNTYPALVEALRECLSWTKVDLTAFDEIAPNEAMLKERIAVIKKALALARKEA